jgi:hypothetical protein
LSGPVYFVHTAFKRDAFSIAWRGYLNPVLISFTAIITGNCIEFHTNAIR